MKADTVPPPMVAPAVCFKASFSYMFSHKLICSAIVKKRLWQDWFCASIKLADSVSRLYNLGMALLEIVVKLGLGSAAITAVSVGHGCVSGCCFALLCAATSCDLTRGSLAGG